jgi:type IV pilus assembly protein PilC
VPSQFFSTSPVRNKDITQFLRQLIMLLDAGTPLLRALTTLSERSSRGGVRVMVKDIAEYVENGNALWQAIERHSHTFTSVEVNLIRASEASGTLLPVLEQITQYRISRTQLEANVRRSLIYPVVVVIVAGAVALLMAKLVVPELQALFSKLAVEPPGYSKAIMGGTV